MTPDLDHLEREYEALIAREDARLDFARDRFSQIAAEQAERMAIRQRVHGDQLFLQRLERRRHDNRQEA